MILNGEYNTLTVLRETSVGFFLGDDEGNDVLLPNKYIPADLKVDDEIEVFCYQDSEDRIIATTLKPAFTLNQFTSLRVTDVNKIGAFMEWGLEKDLLVPFREQKSDMIVGHWYIVYLYLDIKTGRLAGSTKLAQFYENDDIKLRVGDLVEVLATEKTDLGFNVIINDLYLGLIYENEIFQEVKQGYRLQGFVKKIREDGKIDVSLQKQGYQNVEPNAKFILEEMEANNGFLPLNDKSAPDDIKETLEMSKKTFKKSIGALYKQKLIRIETDGIYLIEQAEEKTEE